MKNVLITGGASGFGKYLTCFFAKNHYNVVFTYYKSSPEEIINEIKDLDIDYLPIHCDLRSEEDINMMIEKSCAFGDIDILINNAAVEYNTDFDLKSKVEFMETLEVNLVAPFLISRKIGYVMYKNKKGVIINISSNNAFDKNDPNTIDYDASKKALISLSSNTAKYFSPYVRVNTIAPGWIKTDKIKELDDSLNGVFLENEKEKTLIKEIPSEEDIANVIMYLVSDNAKFINNEVIRVDGGLL